MNRIVGLALLVMLPLSLGAGQADVQIRFPRDRDKACRLTIETQVEGQEAERLTAASAAKTSCLGLLLTGPAADIKTHLEGVGLEDVSVSQELDATGGISNSVKAKIQNINVLGLELKEDESDQQLSLKGALRCPRPPGEMDPAALDNITVNVTLHFQGSVTVNDNVGKPSYTQRAVTYSRAGKDLLGKRTTVDVSVLPDLEGEPKFWLALTWGVTILVIIGAVIVFQHGPRMLKKRPKRPQQQPPNPS
jgi:hypothetical protein